MRTEQLSATMYSRQLRTFLRWWQEELVSLLPARLRRQLQYREHQLVCSFSSSTVQIVDCHRGAVQRSVELTPDEQGRLSAEQHEQLAGVSCQGGEQVAIRLPQEQVLSLSFSLPREAESNLDEVLGYELGRHAPFKIEQVYYGYTILERHNGERKIWLAVSVVPRKQVEPLLAQVREWGLRPVAVTADDARAGEAASPCARGGVNLLPQHERGSARGSVNRAVKLLLLLALLLTSALAGYPLVLQVLHIDELQRQVAIVKRDAVSVQSMQQEMESMAAEAAFVDDRKHQYPEVLDILDTLTRLLPDDTWLERFEMKGERIRIQGMSADASQLIELLENSPLMQKVSFDSPIVKDQRIDRFRFQIVAELVSRGAK